MTLRVPHRLARSMWDGVHDLARAAEATPAGLMVPADVLDRLVPAACRLVQQATHALQRAGVDAWVLEGILGQAGVLHYQDHGRRQVGLPRHMLTTPATFRREAA